MGEDHYVMGDEEPEEKIRLVDWWLSEQRYFPAPWVVLTLIIAVSIPIIAFFTSPFFGCDTQDQWFARSGSLTVLIVAFTEYKYVSSWRSAFPELKIMIGDISKNDKHGAKFIDKNLIKPQLEVFGRVNRVSIALIFLGTVIWGYGDLIFLAIRS